MLFRSLATVEGEEGSGKLLLAETLHGLGPCAAGPFTPALATQFVEHPQPIWNQAHSGLLYLARVDELSGEMQLRLREILEQAAHERIRTRVIAGPLQSLAGSSQPLRWLAAEGGFRSDVAARLTAIRFVLPPLRERQDDIPLLADALLQRWVEQHSKRVRGFLPEALNRLGRYAWPGNALELRTVVEAAALECPGEWIRPIDLPALGAWTPARTAKGDFPAGGAVRSATGEDSAEEDTNLDRAILRHVARVLAIAGGNKVRAARMLGISRSTLYRLLESGGTSETAHAADEQI